MMEEVTYSRDTSTGERFVETQDLPDYQGPAIAAIGKGYGDRQRWAEAAEAKAEIASSYNPEETEPTPDLNMLVADREEETRWARTGRASFSGLGGLIGPNGSIRKVTREDA